MQIKQILQLPGQERIDRLSARLCTCRLGEVAATARKVRRCLYQRQAHGDLGAVLRGDLPTVMAKVEARLRRQLEAGDA